MFDEHVWAWAMASWDNKLAQQFVHENSYDSVVDCSLTGEDEPSYGYDIDEEIPF